MQPTFEKEQLSLKIDSVPPCNTKMAVDETRRLDNISWLSLVLNLFAKQQIQPNFFFFKEWLFGKKLNASVM
jgi:hypothetical protein